MINPASRNRNPTQITHSIEHNVPVAIMILMRVRRSQRRQRRIVVQAANAATAADGRRSAVQGHIGNWNAAGSEAGIAAAAGAHNEGNGVAVIAARRVVAVQARLAGAAAAAGDAVGICGRPDVSGRPPVPGVTDE